jgi:hypothetical protein
VAYGLPVDKPQPLTVRNLMAELDYPVARGRRAEILVAVVDALQPLYALIIEAGGAHRGEGERTFAMFHLATRSVSDLVASAHLASHAYLQQAYGTMRPVHENCDLMELFAREPGEAAIWINGDQPGKDYRPGKVRERLASDPVDAREYGYLSEMGSHPRFAGSRLTGLMRVAHDDPKNRRVVLRVGPFYPAHPATVYVYLYLFQMVIRLGLKLRHLTKVTERMTREQWVTAYLESATAVARGCKACRAELIDMGVGEETEGIETMYDDLIAALKREPGAKDPAGERRGPV